MKKTLVIAMLLTLCATSAFAALDGFAYSGGAFNNGLPDSAYNGGWNKTDVGTSWIQISSQTVQIKGGDTGGGDRTIGNDAFAWGLTGTIYVDFDIMGDATGGGTTWGIWIDGDNGANLARFYGTAKSATGRVGGIGVVTGGGTLTGPGTWDHASVVIDTAANTSAYYLNSTLLGTLNHYQGTNLPTDTVGRVKIHKVTNAGAANLNVYVDNLWVGNTPVPEPASLLALMTGLVGIVGFARRRK